MFIQTGVTVFSAIFQLFVISLAAGLLARKQIVTEGQVSALSTITINIFLPCLILAKTLSRFNPETMPQWWLLPLSGMLMAGGGLALSGLMFRFKSEKRPLMALSSMQNAIYIALPVGQMIFPDEFDLFALYCFLLVLGLNPVMWSLGKVMISGDQKAGIKLKDFITPPLAAIFISVAAVMSRAVLFIPDVIIESVDLMGQATVPAAVFVLGATMGAMSFRQMPRAKDILIVALVKFVMIPTGVFGLLYFGNVYAAMPLFCSMLMVQACSPPATNLVLIVKSYGGDTQAISSMMLILYVISIFVMPLWISLWLFAIG